jgi:hypothetical protein
VAGRTGAVLAAVGDLVARGKRRRRCGRARSFEGRRAAAEPVAGERAYRRVAGWQRCLLGQGPRRLSALIECLGAPAFAAARYCCGPRGRSRGTLARGRQA